MKHERELIRRPVPDCPPLPQQVERHENWNRIKPLRIRSELAQYGDDLALGVTVFNQDGLPEARFWISSEQYGAQVFCRSGINTRAEREPDRMYKATVSSFYDVGRYYGVREEFYGTKEDEATIRDFLDARKNETVADAIRRHQDAVLKAKRDVANARKQQRIEQRFEGIEPPPKNFIQWILDGPMKNYRYLWFAESGKKSTSAVCSYCGKTVTLQGPYRVNGWGSCPVCGSRAQYRSAKRMARKYGEGKTEYVASLEAHAGQILVRSYMVKLAFGGGLNQNGLGLKGRLYTWERYRHWIDPQTGEVTDVYKKDNGNSVVSVDGFVPGDKYSGCPVTWIWPGNLEELRKNTLVRYIPLEKAAEAGLRAEPERLWRCAICCPASEYLIKLGLYRLAGHALRDHAWLENDKVMNYRGHNPAEVLRIEKNDIPILLASDPDEDALCLFRSLRKCGIRLTAEHVRQLVELEISDTNAKRLHDMMKDLSPGKALRYIQNQGKDGDHVLQLWQDYIGMAKELGIDLKDKTLKYPRKLKVAHDEAAKVQQLRKNAKIDAAVGKTAKKLEKLCWEFDGLMIRPAHSQTELWEEGQKLHHCVGRMGYADKMAKGKTAIFFIREKKQPEIPYKTLELNLEDGRVIQCYGSHDSYPGDKVKKFYTKWQAELAAPFCNIVTVKKEGKTA